MGNPGEMGVPPFQIHASHILLIIKVFLLYPLSFDDQDRLLSRTFTGLLNESDFPA